MTDGELLQQYIQNRSEQAFAELVRRHGAMVRSVAARLASEDADDVAQAAFLLLSQRAARLAGYANLAGWLYRATRLCALNANRIRRRRLKHTAAAGVIAMNHQQDAKPRDPFAAMSDALDYALSRLGESQRQVIILRYLEGHSLEAVAGELGLSVSAVAKRAERALDRLREIFAARGVDSSGAALAVMLQAQTPPLTAAQSAALIKAGAGGAATSAVSIAAASGAGLGLKIAAGIVLAIVVVAGVKAVVSRPPHSFAARQAQIAASQAAALSADDAKAAVAKFFTALRTGDQNALANMLAIPDASQRDKAAAAYISSFRTGPYAVFPQRLSSTSSSMFSSDASGQLIDAQIDAAPPTDALLDRFSVHLVPLAGKWRIAELKTTAGDVVLTGPAAVAASKVGNAPPGTYAAALKAVDQMLSDEDVDILGAPLTDGDKPRLLKMIDTIEGDFREVDRLLRATNLALPADRVKRMLAEFARFHDVLQTRGMAAFVEEGKKVAAGHDDKNDGQAMLDLRHELAGRVDAEVAANDAAQLHADRVPPFAADVELTFDWDKNKHKLPGPLAIPPWFLQSETFRRWKETRNAAVLQTTDGKGNLYMITCVGVVADPQTSDPKPIIPFIRQYRPDGTIAAQANFDPDGHASGWATFDQAGKAFTVRVEARDTSDGRGVTDVRFFKRDGSSTRWQVEPPGIVWRETLVSPIGDETNTVHPGYAIPHVGKNGK